MSMERKSTKALFDALEIWSRRKNSFSLNDFLKEKEISLDEFEQIANRSKKFMKIWGKAESRAWENVLNALFTKSLPRSKIAEYIKESEVFQDKDPEEIMQSLEKGQAKLELYLTAIGDTESLRKYGRIGCKANQTEALLQCSLERGMITQKEYEELMAIDDSEDELTISHAHTRTPPLKEPSAMKQHARKQGRGTSLIRTGTYL